MPCARLLTAYLTLQWIVLSSAVILFNQHLIRGWDLPFPASLVLCHQLFTAIVCRMVALLARLSYGSDVLDGVDRATLARMLPISACFAASLILSNAAYTHISVAFIQMIKASTPVVVLLLSFLVRTETPGFELAGIILLVSSGVSLSCVAEIDFVAVGFVLQAVAILCESTRLVLTNVLLVRRDTRLSSFTTLAYLSPMCAACILPYWCLVEAAEVQKRTSALPSPLVLLANCTVAFLLNVASMQLIRATSALTLNVAGVFKDVLLVAWSVAVLGARVTNAQYVGYGVAMLGILLYTRYRHRGAQEKIDYRAVATDENEQESERLIANDEP